jgi:hypothetical protein
MSGRIGNFLLDCCEFGETSGVTTVATPSQADREIYLACVETKCSRAKGEILCSRHSPAHKISIEIY